MRPIGYMVLLNSHFRDTIAFSEAEAKRAAEMFCPAAKGRVGVNDGEEKHSVADLAAIFASLDKKENRFEVLERIKSELEDYWRGKYF
ncbi:MAG: hypothetical protein PHO62_08040 [Sulfurimonas sp.]|uniref:hypothetical protein n=1 Tax=Sulfurimonas sp. TaxID=2022749 RepID=UPI002619840C|nr:hypothetical protein [Sulfurimonas sp.]MDD5373358.1 hypothetical protein [Sulfurimonas sp.]